MNQHINRVTPALAPEHMRSFRVVQPLATHFRPATCAEADCAAYLHGWVTKVDEGVDLGQRQAHYIRTVSGRSFTEQREGALTAFEFEAGQTCFAPGAHQVPVGRDPLFVVRDGDWRGNPRGTKARIHTSAENWRDDMGEQLDVIRDVKSKG